MVRGVVGKMDLLHVGGYRIGCEGGYLRILSPSTGSAMRGVSGEGGC